MSSILPTREDASDVAQEVFIKLWLMRAALPDITSLRFYLYRMSLNQTINFMKKDRFRNSSVLADIPYDQMVEEVIDMKDKEAFIASVVERMPEQRRKVFVMSRFENRSNDEIASILNIKKKTVENHLNLALKELRTALPASLFLFIAFFYLIDYVVLICFWNPSSHFTSPYWILTKIEIAHSTKSNAVLSKIILK